MTANEKSSLKSQDASLAGSDDAGKDTPPAAAPAYVYMIASFAALNSVNLGFDIGVNSGVGILLQEDLRLTNFQLGVFMGSLHFVAALGGFCSHEFSDRLGRRLTFTIAQVLFFIGIVVLCTAQSYTMILVSRVFLGFGVGISLAINPMYITEVAPASHRGKLTTLSEIAINVGILIGFFSNWAFADLPDGVNWRVMIACGGVLPVLIFILSLTIMPESPRWLIARGQAAIAEELLRSTHPPGEDVSALVDGIKRQVEQDEHYAELGWQPLLRPDDFTRRMMVAGIGCAFAQQASGIESIVMYSPTIFKMAGVATTVKEMFAMTVLMGVVKTFFIIVAAAFLDSFGRRPLLIISIIGMALSQATLSAAFAHQWSLVAASAVMVYVAFFSIGIGPICWLLASEVFPLHIRAKAMSVATTLNRLTSAAVAFSFLPLSDFMGFSGYFLLFACLTGSTAVGAWFCVPETKGHTLEELTDILGGGSKGKYP